MSFKIKFNFKDILGKASLSSPKNDEINVSRDWEIIGGTVFVLVLTASIFCFYLYYSAILDKRSSSYEDGGALIESVNRNELDSVSEIFDDKRRLFQDLRSSKPRISTP